jgi:hypothetical protein
VRKKVILKPVKFIDDPFRKDIGKIVLCEALNDDASSPSVGNFRFYCEKIMKEAAH